MPPVRTAAFAVLGARIAYGAVLAVAPASVTRRWLGPAVDHPPTQVALRALGVREILLHAGAVAAAARGGPLRPWLAASMAGDLSDVAATFAGRSGLPPGSPPATAVVAGGSAVLSGVIAAAAER
jgi:hypothetical protein